MNAVARSIHCQSEYPNHNAHGESTWITAVYNTNVNRKERMEIYYDGNLDLNIAHNPYQFCTESTNPLLYSSSITMVQTSCTTIYHAVLVLFVHISVVIRLKQF